MSFLNNPSLLSFTILLVVLGIFFIVVAYLIYKLYKKDQNRVTPIELAEIILVGAINRCESRGAHYREDYPELNSEFLANTIYWKDDGILASTFEKIINT
jgi:hypothetical protein